MKITKKDLAKIIAEETAGEILEEGFFDKMKASIEKLKGKPKEPEDKPSMAPSITKAEKKIDDKKVIEGAGILMANHGADLRRSEAFKKTPLFQKYIAKEEGNLQEQTPFEKEFVNSLSDAVKQGDITTKEIYDSIRMLYGTDKSLRSAIKSASSDMEKVFDLKGLDNIDNLKAMDQEDMPLSAEEDLESFLNKVADDIDIEVDEAEMIVGAIEKAETEKELQDVYNKFKKEIDGSDDLSWEMEQQAGEIQGTSQVTDDQIEFEAPAGFKAAEEIPASQGGAKDSTAPKPSPLPSSVSQTGGEESTSAARPSAKGTEDTKMDTTMASKTTVDDTIVDQPIEKTVSGSRTPIDIQIAQAKNKDDMNKILSSYQDRIKGDKKLRDQFEKKFSSLDESNRWKKLAGILKD